MREEITTAIRCQIVSRIAVLQSIELEEYVVAKDVVQTGKPICPNRVSLRRLLENIVLNYVIVRFIRDENRLERAVHRVIADRDVRRAISRLRNRTTISKFDILSVRRVKEDVAFDQTRSR